MFKTVKAKNICFERKARHEKEEIMQHFNDFKDIVGKYTIFLEDIYSMIETGFRIGCLDGHIVLTLAEARSIYITDPNYRDYITAVETICGDGTAIPPLIIMKAKILMENHFRNNLEQNTLLLMSDTDYINNDLGFEWLVHFEKMIEQKKKGVYRMLIMNGQESHISEEFTV
ncbi:hypothetical protein K3495_g1376 [Podosphaera aphanis]|nr:hypothetical protein K3495_g1376 [Podosphaera aphanis]